MASDVEDSQLLSAYANQRSERAFQALVERHVGLVYSTAVRQLDDHASAQEVTQNVFITLARKPHAFRHESTLAGWLYKTALLQARQCIRSELRRKHREHTAVEIGTVANNADSGWDPLLPLLDEAILSLRERDRLAVVLRFFEAKPLRAVGHVLGISEDAAQKRVAKALDTLTNFFRRRGFTVPALTLSTPILKDAAKAAPVGLAASVVQIALHQAAIAPLSGVALLLTKFMAITKTQTAAVCLLVGAIPVAVEWNSLGNARAEQTGLNTELQSARADLTDTESRLAFLGQRRILTEADLAALRQRPRSQPSAVAAVAPEPESYPWSEDSEYVRVPKSLLSNLSILSHRATRVLTNKLAMSDEFIGVLRLTPGEAERVNTASAEAQHLYHLLAAKHLEPSEGHVSYPGDKGTMERVSFRLTPFSEEGTALQENLEKAVLSILGEERSKLFWSQFSPFGNLIPGKKRPVFETFSADGGQTTYTYMRKNFPEPHVSLAQSRGGASGANRFYPEEDQYVPEALKPVLERWRAEIKQQNINAEAQTP